MATITLQDRLGTLTKGLRLLLYLLVFADAELVTANVNEQWGITFHFVILVGLITHSVVVGKGSFQNLFLALGLVPLIRIVSLAVPVGEISEIYWYIIIAVPVVVGVYMVMQSLALRWADVGLQKGTAIPLQILVAVAGMGLGAIDYAILEPESLIDELTFQEAILPVLILLVATGLVEELVFRGVIQRAAQAVRAWGWVHVAGLYAVLQIGHGSVGHCLFAFAVALCFGWIVKKTGAIWGVSLSHGLLNVGLYLVFPHLL